jgi:Fic family protein
MFMDIIMDMELFEKDVNITPKILKLISELDEFKGSWTSLSNLAPEKLNNLKKIATIESIGSSTRIEGVKLSNYEIKNLLSGIDINSFKNRDEEEVGGYSRLMNIIFESFDEIKLSENIIKQLHKELLYYATKDIHHRGEYKRISNQVEAFDSNGKSIGIVFETATPFETPYKMEKLVKWLNISIKEQEIHPLITISVFIVAFLAIHPFQDGNGRLSRALTTLLLLQNSYKYVPYSSLERVVEENKDHYYIALREAQSEEDVSVSGLVSWITFFLECLVKQKRILSKKIERENLMSSLSKLSEDILILLREHGKLSVRDIVRLTGANRNTVKSNLFKLVENKKIRKEGLGKGTVYLL